jgi:L-ribulose-5-phosphate 3-epimerase
MSRFILSAFGDEISPHLDEQVRVLRMHRIDHLECRSVEGRSIVDYTIPDVRVIYERLGEQGISISALGSPIGKIPITEDFTQHLKRFEKSIEIAHTLHTRFIRMFSFYIPAGEDPAQYRDEVINRWLQFIAIAKGSNLVLLHENEKGIYGDTAERCLDLLGCLNCASVKAVFDPANFIQCGEETYPHAYHLLSRYVVYLHIKDALYRDQSVVPAGQGDGKLPEILGELDRAGFDGFLSIEPHLNDSLPGGGAECFSIATQALKTILAHLGRKP